MKTFTVRISHTKNPDSGFERAALEVEATVAGIVTWIPIEVTAFTPKGETEPVAMMKIAGRTLKELLAASGSEPTVLESRRKDTAPAASAPAAAPID